MSSPPRSGRNLSHGISASGHTRGVVAIAEQAQRTKEQRTSEERESPQGTPVVGGIANGVVARVARAGVLPPGAATPRLARAVGNRAMTQLVSRDNGTAVKDKPKVKPKKDPVQYNLPAGAYELALKKKFGDRASISVKLTASFHKNTKVVEAKAGDDQGSAAISFWENKRMRERAGGKTVDKIQAALARGELSGELAPGLKVKANTKLLEMQVEKAKADVDFALITISVLIEGDITKWFLEAADVPEDRRSGIKITITGEAKIAPQLSDIARIRDMQKARKQAMAAATEVEKAAKRANVVHRELEAVEKQAKQLEKHADSFKKWDAKAKKQFKSHKAWKKAKNEAAARLKDKLKTKAALETEKAVLKTTLKAQGEILERSKNVIANAASGLKSKAGKLLGKALATSAGKFIARKLAYAIPILNVLAIAWDIIEVVGVFRKLWNGAKIGFGGGDDGDSGDDKGTAGSGSSTQKDADKGAGAGGGGGDAGGGQPDGTTQGPDGGTGPGDGGGGTVQAPDAGKVPGPDGGTQGGPSDAPGTPVLEPPAPLHPGAQSVAEALKSGGIQLDKDQVWQLDSVIPKDLTADQMKELLKRLEAMKGGTGAMDPYELIGLIQGEVEKVRRGHDEESELTWVDGQFSEVLSTGAPADVLKKEAAAEEAKDPSQTGGTPPDPNAKPSKDAGDKAAQDSADKAAKPPPKKGAKGAKPPPKSLMPTLPGSFLSFDEKTNKFEWAQGGHDKLTGTFYNLSDGLEVLISQAVIDQQVAGDVILLSLGFEVEVQTLPPKAGKDYPWKVGDKKVYWERYSFNPKTGESHGVEANPAGTSSARSVLALKGDTVVLVGKTITFGKGVSVRVASISDQAREEQDDATEFTVTLHVVVTAAPPKGHMIIDVDQNPVTLLKGKAATIRMSIYRDKPKATTK